MDRELLWNTMNLFSGLTGAVGGIDVFVRVSAVAAFPKLAILKFFHCKHTKPGNRGAAIRACSCS